MKYTKGAIGRVFLIKFSDKDIFLKEIEKIDHQKKDKRIAVQLTLSKEAQIQPEISRLAAKHHWIIWKSIPNEQ